MCPTAIPRLPHYFVGVPRPNGKSPGVAQTITTFHAIDLNDVNNHQVDHLCQSANLASSRVHMHVANTCVWSTTPIRIVCTSPATAQNVLVAVLNVLLLTEIETIAASYVPPASGDASVRLFNLSPTTKLAGLSSSKLGSPSISGVKYSLGSDWESFPLGDQQWSFTDESVHPAKTMLQSDGSPAGPPIGNTQFLLGMTSVGSPLRALPLNDAPVSHLTSSIIIMLVRSFAKHHVRLFMLTDYLKWGLRHKTVRT